MDYCIDFYAELPDHENHRALWTWLAENPGMSKQAWPGFSNMEETPLNNCFACKAVQGRCYNCPISWVDDNGVQQHDCCSAGTLYSKWYSHFERSVIDAAAMSALALQIAELPWDE